MKERDFFEFIFKIFVFKTFILFKYIKQKIWIFLNPLIQCYVFKKGLFLKFLKHSLSSKAFVSLIYTCMQQARSFATLGNLKFSTTAMSEPLGWQCVREDCGWHILQILDLVGSVCLCFAHHRRCKLHFEKLYCIGSKNSRIATVILDVLQSLLNIQWWDSQNVL